MKHKKTANTIIEEIVANGIGWVAGLLSIDILDYFFIEKSWKNAWGIFSKRTAIDSATFSLLEWLLTAIIGFAVMLIVNKFVRKKLFKKRKTEEEINEETVDKVSEVQHEVTKVYQEETTASENIEEQSLEEEGQSSEEKEEQTGDDEEIKTE